MCGGSSLQRDNSKVLDKCENSLAILVGEQPHFQSCPTDHRSDLVSSKSGNDVGCGVLVVRVCVLNVAEEEHSVTSAPLHRGRVTVCISKYWSLDSNVKASCKQLFTLTLQYKNAVFTVYKSTLKQSFWKSSPWKEFCKSCLCVDKRQ